MCVRGVYLATAVCLCSAASVTGSQSACGERNGHLFFSWRSGLKGSAASEPRQSSESCYVMLTARGWSRRGINNRSAEP